jgi:CDP-glucose 4,6-dehydratase
MEQRNCTLESVGLRKVDPAFWKDKKVFLTGHSGFKGSWLTIWLLEMGVRVYGYSLSPSTNPSLFEIANIQKLIHGEFNDICNAESLQKSMKDFDPEIVIHMAAQPLVRQSYDNPLKTYETNVIGTLNVLESARNCKKVKSIVIVTTDKCYQNNEWDWGYRETDILGGFDPYSSSKACAELLTSSYRNSFFKDTKTSVATVRAGNVIGGGDWSKDRLIPDILDAIKNNKKIIVRNIDAIRPWQHVLEPLSGYLMLAEDLYNHGNKFADAWNFGPNNENCQTVEEILRIFAIKFPNWVGWQIQNKTNVHEAKLLKLDCSKAINYIRWIPKWGIETTINLISNWQSKVEENIQNAYGACLSDIEIYNKKD